MGWFSRKRLSPIGLDVGSRAVKAVQLAGEPGAWRVAAATLIPREEGAAGADGAGLNGLMEGGVARIGQVLSRQGFVGDELVLAVPGETLRGGMIELPRRDSGAPLEQIARMETATLHRLTPGSFELAWAELPAGSRQHDLTRATVAACPHDEAEAMLDAFAEHGMEVVVLDVAASALARLADVAEESQQHVLVVMDLGQTAATLMLIYRGCVIYERRLPESGFGALADRMMQEFALEAGVARYLLEDVGLTDDPDHPDAMPTPMRAMVTQHLEDLARELNVSLSYAKHQYGDVAVGPVMLVGGAAKMLGLAEALTLHVPDRATVLTPGHRAAVAEPLLGAGHDPAFSLATALAMHESGGEA
ncbi:MAG: pilus assembly protein PilM [Phycisphaeraceae bacterium]